MGEYLSACLTTPVVKQNMGKYVSSPSFRLLKKISRRYTERRYTKLDRISESALLH